MLQISTDTIIPSIPDDFLQSEQPPLPGITADTLTHLSANRWRRIGIIAALLDRSGNILMIEHNASQKTVQGALGPLSETSQINSDSIEQPVQTLCRGIHEELGIDTTVDLDLALPKKSGWAINAWPHGKGLNQGFSLGIAFPVLVGDDAKSMILDRADTPTPEIGSHRSFLQPDVIMGMDNGLFRPGVKPWLTQLGAAGLLDLNPGDFEKLQPVDNYFLGTDIILQDEE